MTKRFLLIFIMLGMAILSFGQDMSVRSFYLAETDLTANTPGTMVHDQNGNVCALIKVETTLDGFSFDVGALGVCEVKREGGEIWVYVPFGIRRVTISHPQLGIIRNYALPCAIERGRTYILKLNSALGNRVYDSSKKQKMILKVFPTNAHVEVNGIEMPLNNMGIHEQDYSFGIYEVVVSAPKYHTQRRLLEINNPSQAQEFTINLKQAYGWLVIPGDGDEKLTLDGHHIPFEPNAKTEVMSGHYQVLIEKPFYKPYKTTIEVNDSTVNKLNPTFEINYRELDLRVYNEAEIWIDGIRVATGDWRGKLEYGSHKVECKKESHRTTEKVLEVDPQTLGPIVLESPTPIYGYLDINSSPAGAQIFVDDKFVGNTPSSVQVLVGERHVSIKQGGYNTENVKVQVKESETSKIDVKLSDIISVSIASNPAASIYIDDKPMGKTPWSSAIPSGEYKIRLEADKYHDFEKVVSVDSENKDFKFKLKRRYFKPLNFYISGEYQILSNNGIKGSIGTFVKNINIEANVVYGLKECEVIYWNIPEQMTKPSGYTYKPMYFGGRIGYGFIIGNRLRITPQAGAGLLMIKGSKVDSGATDPLTTDGYSVPALVGCRLDFAVAPAVALSLTPNYSFAIIESELYKQVSSTSKIVKGYSSGPSMGIGVCFMF